MGGNSLRQADACVGRAGNSTGVPDQANASETDVDRQAIRADRFPPQAQHTATSAHVHHCGEAGLTMIRASAPSVP